MNGNDPNCKHEQTFAIMPLVTVDGDELFMENDGKHVGIIHCKDCGLTYLVRMPFNNHTISFSEIDGLKTITVP